MIKQKRNMVIGIVLIVALIITGIFAFMTSTDDRNNIFTVGDVKIELYENLEGNYYDASIDTTNTSAAPGVTYEKEPWVKNTGHLDAFVYMVIGVPYDDIVAVDANNQELNDGEETETALFDFLVSGRVAKDAEKMESNWVFLRDISADELGDSAITGDDASKYVYKLFEYNKKLAPNEETTALFEEVRLANFTLDNDMTDPDLSFSIPIYAFACQTTGLNRNLTVGGGSTTLTSCESEDIANVMNDKESPLSMVVSDVYDIKELELYKQDASLTADEFTSLSSWETGHAYETVSSTLQLAKRSGNIVAVNSIGTNTYTVGGNSLQFEDGFYTSSSYNGKFYSGEVKCNAEGVGDSITVNTNDRGKVLEYCAYYFAIDSYDYFGLQYDLYYLNEDTGNYEKYVSGTKSGGVFDHLNDIATQSSVSHWFSGDKYHLYLNMSDDPDCETVLIGYAISSKKTVTIDSKSVALPAGVWFVTSPVKYTVGGSSVTFKIDVKKYKYSSSSDTGSWNTAPKSTDDNYNYKTIATIPGVSIKYKKINDETNLGSANIKEVSGGSLTNYLTDRWAKTKSLNSSKEDAGDWSSTASEYYTGLASTMDNYTIIKDNGVSISNICFASPADNTQTSLFKEALPSGTWCLEHIDVPQSDGTYKRYALNTSYAYFHIIANSYRVDTNKVTPKTYTMKTKTGTLDFIKVSDMAVLISDLDDMNFVIETNFEHNGYEYDFHIEKDADKCSGTETDIEDPSSVYEYDEYDFELEVEVDDNETSALYCAGTSDFYVCLLFVESKCITTFNAELEPGIYIYKEYVEYPFSLTITGPANYEIGGEPLWTDMFAAD